MIRVLIAVFIAFTVALPVDGRPKTRVGLSPQSAARPAVSLLPLESTANSVEVVFLEGMVPSVRSLQVGVKDSLPISLHPSSRPLHPFFPTIPDAHRDIPISACAEY